MKLWYDACTGKHVRYGTAIAKRLRKAGHEVIFTIREHPDTLTLAKMLGETPVVVGKYSPKSLFTRLEESANRMLHFAKLFEGNTPDIAISHQSVDLSRVAFGLNIPLVLTADTPYAEAVNRLTIPLADRLIVSKAIPQRIFRRYGVNKIDQFDGVDEVAWTQDFNPSRKCEFPKPLIIVRQMEARASYALGRTDVSEKLAQQLKTLGNVLFVARYNSKKRKGLLYTKSFVDAVDLVASADLVVGMGGTIVREAALQGIPSIVLELGRTYVNEYLAQKGFPLFIVEASHVLTTAKKYLGKKWDVKDKLAKLENPICVIEKIVEEKLSLQFRRGFEG